MNPESGSGQKNQSWKVNLLAITITVVWGTSFPVIHIALNSGLSSFGLLTFRFLLAALVLLVVFRKRLKPLNKSNIVTCAINGAMAFLTYGLNTMGMGYTTPSMGAFITSSYVVFVPLVVWIFDKRRPGLAVVLLSLVSFAGVIILTPFDGGTGKLLGNALVFASAVISALHIVYISKVVMRVTAEMLSLTQICAVFMLSGIAFLISGEWRSMNINYTSAVLSVVFLGILCTAFCISVQSYVQSKIKPEAIAILFSMEGLFGCLFSIILRIEKPSPRVFIGGFIILAAVICVNLVQVKQTEKA